MERKKSDIMIRINPRTGRNIIVGGKVWKSLTEEERQKANKLCTRTNTEVPVPPPIPDSEVKEAMIHMDTEEEVPDYPICHHVTTNAYIQNILKKTQEAEDRVKILLYRRFFMDNEEVW